MSLKVPDMKSLNKTVLSDLSIDELESRLQCEDLDARTEMWTSCGCYGDCPCNKACHLTCV